MATVKQKQRKMRVLEVLQTQLKAGVKTEKRTFDKKVPLTDGDKSRIEREIQNLKNKL